MPSANVNLSAIGFTQLFDQVTLYGMLQGAGAAAPTIPTTTVSNTSSVGFCQASANILSLVAADTTRTGAGQYTTKIRQVTPAAQPPLVFDVGINVWGPSGIWGSIVDFNPSTGVLTFRTFGASGTATDATTSEFIRFTFTGQLAVQSK